MTPREREVLALLARGQTNREIAQVLVISEVTVRSTYAIFSTSSASATEPKPLA